MNTEEMSKLWTALSTHYWPTAAYHISVVLIESNRSTKTALPVRSRNVYVLPFDQPFIEERHLRRAQRCRSPHHPEQHFGADGAKYERRSDTR